ncbi:ABC transporter B family member 10 [Frankliniella fusca]|uniref:ABC transporter B family member 10 n=1 Tax=Frankliniella fusca TaxID=407009 RepID=A0AAE1I375_9NEOP|nr:ABC transporter B family member 10 [Frankliniella fusca]
MKLQKESKGGEEEFPWEDVLEGLTGEPPTAVTDFSWDFTRHERVDTLPDLGVDLTHSSASSAANSNSAEDDSDDAASLRAAGGTSSRQDGKDLDWDQDEPDAAYSSLIRRGAQSLPVTICRGFEDADDGLGDEDNSEDPVYANCLLEDEPLYENFSQQLSGLGGLDALDYSDDEEHIYEHVHHHGHGGRDGHHPVNVFLALLQGSAPISPDPNIYEVPPGAIRCTGLHRDLDCLDSARNITPPSGFQDYEKLSWVRAAGSIRSAAAFYDDDPLDVPVHHYLRVDTLRDTVVTAAAQDEQDRHKLPEEVIYSTIVKPRRKKKQRPAISAMLQIAASMQPTPQASAEVVETVQAAGKDTEQSQADVNDNFIVVDSSEPVARDSALVVQAEADCAQVSGSDVVSVEEVNSVIVNATEAPVGDVIVLTVKPSAEADNADHTVTRDCGSSELVIVTPPTPPVVSDDEDAAEEADTEAESEVVEVIEISSDGRWDTKELPPTEVDEALMQQQQLGQEDGCFQECPAEEAKIKHAAMAYGSQYYVHAPAAGAQQQRTVVLVNTEDAGSAAPAAVSNIGTQIMKMYEDDRQKVRDSLNLPDVSLLDMDESMEDIERERRRVIVNQAVRAKRISSWIKSSDQQGGPQDPQDPQDGQQDPQDGEDAAQQHEDAGLHLNEDAGVAVETRVNGPRRRKLVHRAVLHNESSSRNTKHVHA